MATRRFFVGGNWKMNGSMIKLKALIEFINESCMDLTTEVVLAPQAMHLQWVIKNLTKVNCSVAVQNVYFAANGAFTGESSAESAVDIGCKWALIGHSERRHTFGESDDTIAKKVGYCLGNTSINLIVCIGETADERSGDKTMDVISTQMAAIAAKIGEDQWARVVIAYEPVWAIGTGKTASPKQAQEVHKSLRKWLKENVSEEVAEATRIVYGGSVDCDNSVELSKCADIDGFLVGGASLKPQFVNIVNSKTEKPESIV